MLSAEEIGKFAVRWQTRPVNVAREYFQNAFLSYLYQEKAAGGLLFKGGTALRIVHESPRFSEDLDFTGRLPVFHVRKLIESAVLRLRQEGLEVEFKESKPTSGGYLAILEAPMGEWNLSVPAEVSLRRSASKGQVVLIASPLIPPYTLMAMEDGYLVREKVQAVLTRKKSRDYYDLYFILRRRLAVGAVIDHKRQLLKEAAGLDSKLFERELKEFLPKSHWPLLRQFPQALAQELERL